MITIIGPGDEFFTSMGAYGRGSRARYNTPMPPPDDNQRLLQSLHDVVAHVEALLPCAPPTPDWSAASAFRWRRIRGEGHLQAIPRTHLIGLDDLIGMEAQKSELERNTRQFLAGLPANNALLWGARGTGKSSLVKALLNTFREEGLRLVEVDCHELVDLPDILQAIIGRPERFLLFCDDLSFEADDASYKALKAAVDGSINCAPENVLIYATSNRRHLLPEYLRENLDSRLVDGEIHHADAVEERISLSERFGIWLSFHPFSQDTYLQIARHWLQGLGVANVEDDAIQIAALEWARDRASRSGRSAYQFALDWAGREGLEAAARQETRPGHKRGAVE